MTEFKPSIGPMYYDHIRLSEIKESDGDGLEYKIQRCESTHQSVKWLHKCTRKLGHEGHHENVFIVPEDWENYDGMVCCARWYNEQGGMV